MIQQTIKTEMPQTFHNLGIADSILAILDRAGFSIPTPIQHQAIPAAIEGKDIVGIAQTGTGKTLAFGIPLIQRIGLMKGRGLIVLPTRELALQVDETLRKIGGTLGLRTADLIGGESMDRQRALLSRNPHIIVATPGRLVDMMDQKLATISNVTILVLDEADRMFDMGFAPQLNKILNLLPKQRQTMLFSATMPAEIWQIAKKHMTLPIRVEVAPQGTVASQIEQEVILIKKEDKLALLEKLLKESAGPVLVFSRTKHGAKRITRSVREMGFSCAEIHANRSLAQRKDALAGFKAGTYRVLIATDIAARGIDVVGITLVINFDLPDNPEDYVHRIGRTGRAEMSGRAVSFAIPEERNEVRQIERLIRRSLPTSFAAVADLPPRRATPRMTNDIEPRYGRHPRHSYRRSPQFRAPRVSHQYRVQK